MLLMLYSNLNSRYFFIHVELEAIIIKPLNLNDVVVKQEVI